MKSCRVLISCLLVLATAAVSAQTPRTAPAPAAKPVSAPGWQHVGAVTAVQPLPHGMEVRAGNVRVRITALSPSVVRVRYAPGGTFGPDHSFAVLPSTELQAPKVRLQDTAHMAEFATPELRVRVLKRPSMCVVFLNPAGQVVLEDHSRYSAAWNGTAFRVWKSMPEDEHYFGLGDKPGPLDHRNLAFTNWNTDAYGWQESTDPIYKTIPSFIAFRKGAAYGLYLDNTYRSTFDFGKESRAFFSFGADGGDLDYYFFYGPQPKKVLRDYTALLGRTPLPPLFALAYQQCRYSYYPEARVREIAREFRARNIPADVLWLDIDYQEKNRPFTIDRERFPNFEGMVRDLGQQGFKLVVITDLHIAKVPGYKPYEEGLARDYFVHNPDGSVYVGKVWPGESVFPDFTFTPARNWWGTLYADFVNLGIRGFWNDMNEPAVFERADKTMPLDNVHRVDAETENRNPANGEVRRTDHREIHNVFGMENARGTHDGLLRLRPEERPFVMTRAAFPGAWRYSVTWTGDNSSTWNHLRISVPQLLNLGLSGYALAGADIGGFAGTPPADLLTRWTELGAFNPVFRNHTEKNSGNQEPWVHGPEHESIRRRYIELRYKLLPYIYTSVEETSRTGVPLMRPMFLEFPAEAGLESNDTEFMWGPDMLVAPKLNERLEPLEVKLPKGAWFDYWTGTRQQGGSTLKVEAALDMLPVYVRAGAIIPHQPVVQHVDQKPQGPLELRVYPGPDCRGSLYADDGNTFRYQKGEFQRLAFTCQAAQDGVRVSLGAPEGTYKPWWDSFQVTVVGVDRAPRQVSVGGTPVPNSKFDATTRSVSVVVPAGTAADIEVQY